MNIAICFLTTIKDHFNLKLLKEQAKNSKNHNIDIYEYIDNDSEYYIKENTIYFNYQYLKNKFNYNHSWYNKTSGTLSKSGLQFLPWLDMYINHKNEYDMYLYYEDDLSYFSEKNLFDIIDFNCDAIFQNKRNLPFLDNWWWYYNDNNHYLSNKYIPYHGPLHIYGAKGNIIDGFIEFIKDNYFHHELLISSYILTNKYKVNYIDTYIYSYFAFFENNISNDIYYELIHPIKTIEKYNIIYNNGGIYNKNI